MNPKTTIFIIIGILMLTPLILWVVLLDQYENKVPYLEVWIMAIIHAICWLMGIILSEQLSDYTHEMAQAEQEHTRRWSLNHTVVILFIVVALGAVSCSPKYGCTGNGVHTNKYGQILVK